MGEGFIIAVAVLLVLVIPVSVIALIAWAVRQSRGMRALEDSLKLLEAQVMELRHAGTAPAAPRTESPPEPKPETRAQKTDKDPLAVAAMQGPWQPTIKKRDEGEVVPTGGPAQAQSKAQSKAQARIQGPKKEPTPQPDTTTELEESPPKAVVFRRDRMAALGQWLQVNWIYVVSAISLATAGVFLVQYGAENGYLTPRARVWAALAFGAVLVSVGEYLRRRWGDEDDVATAFLPSVFSSAGIITLFAAILAARHLYQMIDSGTTLAGLVATALLAVVLGWSSGPLLAAVGLVGAMAAPFAVGGQSDAPELLYGYFGLVALSGLIIDTMRRWAWVSVLSLVTGFAAAWVLYLEIGKGEWLIALSATLAVIAIAVPGKSLAPSHGGTAIIQTFRFRAKRPIAWPSFPTNLAAGTLVVAVAGITVISLDGIYEFWVSAAILVFLFAALSLWSWRAHALEDLAALPMVALMALPFLQAMPGGAVLRAFRDQLPLGPEDAIPYDPILLAGAALAVSLLAAQRSFLGPRWPVAWAAGAAMAAPLMMVALEAFWFPAEVIGAYPWALTAAVIALGMGVLAERFARADGAPGMRTALVTLAALLMICFALMVMLSETALTLALTATVLAAAALDRRFDMAPLLWFVKAGGIAVGARLVIDPGLAWAETATYWDLFQAYAGVIAILLATLAVLRRRDRAAAKVVIESVAGAVAAVFASVILYRVIDDFAPLRSEDSHWAVSLIGLVWIISAAKSIWRLRIGGPLKWARKILIVIYLLLGAAFLGAAVFLLNPLLGSGGDVIGPIVINTLFVAYMLPAILFALMAWKFSHLSHRWRLLLIVVSSAFAALWLGLDIRHFWRGADLSVSGTTQPELYTYTVAMLVVGAGLLYQAIASVSSALRRVAMSVIALTVAKVFLIDASGLTELTRVFSFLALGLSLAGLAFLNRWAAGQEHKPAEATFEPTE